MPYWLDGKCGWNSLKTNRNCAETLKLQSLFTLWQLTQLQIHNLGMILFEVSFKRWIALIYSLIGGSSDQINTHLINIVVTVTNNK